MRKSAFVKKYSVQFVSPSGRASLPFYFFDRYDRETVAQTWQVLRSEFDQMLLEQRARKGRGSKRRNHRQGIDQGKRPRRRRRARKDKAGEITEYRAPITLDCTGKEAFSAVRNNWRIKDPYPEQNRRLDLLQGRKARRRHR